MSSQRTGENRQEEYERRLSAGTTRLANAEELLSELKRLLESSGRPPFAPQPSSPSASIVSASTLIAAEPQQSTDFDKAHDSADDLRVDGSLKRRPADLRDTYAQHRDLTREVTHLRSRRWRLAASGLALGFAALAGAALALKPAAPGPKSPSSVVPMRAQSDVQPLGAESVVASSDVGGPLMKDGALPDHMQVGSAETGIEAQESTPRTSAAIDAQRPAEGPPRTVAVATTAATPALASVAAGSALAASQTAGLEPVRSVVVSPDGTPIARISTNSADSTSPGETPRPHTEAAPTAGIKVESARPPATKIDFSAAPNASKKSVRRTVAKSGKATAGAMAEAPKQPLSPAQPEKTMTSPTAQAATDPVAATPTVPTTPTTFAAQSVGQLTHALAYLTHLPVALIQHATDPNTEAR